MKRVYFNKNAANAEQKLHRMAMTGQVDGFKDILKEVDDKNPANKFGKTPLHWAARYHFISFLVFFVS